MSSILHDARGLLALMQPLTGERSTGTATVRSTGASGWIPANTHAAPVVGGAIRWDQLVKTAVNPDHDPKQMIQDRNGAWPVTSAGTSVPVVSVLGGPLYNFDAGTVIRWTPTPDGITETATLDSTGMVGGTANQTPVGVAEVKLFEQLDKAPADFADLVRASITRFPSILICWWSFEPDDGQREQPLGNLPSRLGKGKKLLRDTWEIFVLTSRQDSDPARREQGLAILGELREIMSDRHSVDGLVFSTVRGLAIHEGQRWFTSPQMYAYKLRVSTANVLTKRESRTFGPWVRTRLDTNSADPVPFPTVVDDEFNMPQ